MINDELIRKELNSELTKVSDLISQLESNKGKAADITDQLLKAHQIKINLLESLDAI